MKIKVIKQFKPSPYHDFLKIGDVLEVRVLPGSLLNLFQPYQVIDGKYSGVEVPVTNCIKYEESPFAESEYIELKQANLMHIEDIKAITLRNTNLINEASVLDQINSKLRRNIVEKDKTINALELELGLAVTTIERSMLESQQVALPKEVVGAIDFYCSQKFNIAEIYQMGCEGNDGKYAFAIQKWLKQGGSKSTFMASLVNGYRVEQPLISINEQVQAIVSKWIETPGSGSDAMDIGGLIENLNDFKAQIAAS